MHRGGFLGLMDLQAVIWKECASFGVGSLLEANSISASWGQMPHHTDEVSPCEKGTATPLSWFGLKI